MNKQTEVQQGKNIVDAAKKAGVQHLVMRYLKKMKKKWKTNPFESTLENASQISGGKRHVEHFDSKAEIEGNFENYKII